MKKYLLLTGVVFMISQGLYAADNAYLNQTNGSFIKTAVVSKNKVVSGEFYSVRKHHTNH